MLLEAMNLKRMSTLLMNAAFHSLIERPTSQAMVSEATNLSRMGLGVVLVYSRLHCMAQVRLPLDVGTIVEALWRDGKRYPARVIERRLAEGSSQHQYYVHYLRCEPCLLPALRQNSASPLRAAAGLSVGTRLKHLVEIMLDHLRLNWIIDQVHKDLY